MSVLLYSSTFGADPSPFEMFANLDIGRQNTVITLMRPFLDEGLQRPDKINEA